MFQIGLGSWDEFKATCITKKNLNCQYGETPERYEMYGPDDAFLWHVSILKGSDDAADFIANHQVNFNWAVGTRPYPFSSSDFDAAFDAIGGVAAKGEATEFLYKVDEPLLYLNGAMGFGNHIAFGDWVSFDIYDKDGIIPAPYRVAYPNWPIIKTWVKKLYIHTSVPMDVKTSYAGHPPQNMYLRMVYHSVGTVDDVEFYLNYWLHRSI